MPFTTAAKPHHAAADDIPDPSLRALIVYPYQNFQGSGGGGTAATRDVLMTDDALCRYFAQLVVCYLVTSG